MKAFKPGKPNSSIITEYIGSGILQDAKKIHKTLSPDLIYNYFEGEVARTSGIEELQKTESGIISKIDIKKAGECEKFAFIFSGFINIPLDGKYTFHLNSNDGSIFYLDEYLLIENDGPHDAIEMAAPVSLRKGFHPIKLKYFQNGGGKSLNLYWEGPDLQKSEIPESTFFHVE
jgi:hypothetical protein